MSDVLQTISPVDGSTYVERAIADEGQINSTLTRARFAVKQWQQTPIHQRAAICQKAVAAFVDRKEQIAHELCWQMGRPIRYGAGEVAGVQERALHMINIASEALPPVQLPDKTGFQRWIKREPVGVVFIIAPWNYPYLTAINVIIPAIMAGNTVIIKHSSQTPLCAERLVEAFTEAGLPEGVFQYLHLSHQTTEQVIRAGDIDFIAFTGSVAGGRLVEQSSAGRFIGVGLELGGKDPAYIRADADIAQAAETVIEGAYFNSGQSCCGVERIYVHNDVYTDFLEQAVTRVRSYKLGRPDKQETTLGPVVRASAADFVRRQIREAIDQGATAHINSSEFPLDQDGSPLSSPSTAD